MGGCFTANLPLYKKESLRFSVISISVKRCLNDPHIFGYGNQMNGVISSKDDF